MIHINTENAVLRKDLFHFTDENNNIVARPEDLEDILEIISDYIINNVDEKKLGQFIAKRCSTSNLQELKTYASRKVYDYFNRKIRLKSLFIDYLAQSNRLNVDGFIRFRLRDYYNLLERVVGEIADDYLISREYDNFILLIKQLIKTQSSLVDRLTILVSPDQKYQIYDDYMIDITNICINEFLEEFHYHQVNADDFLFSTILSIAPKTVVIHHHSRLKNKDLLNTISKIYEANLILCEGCDTCSREMNQLPE